MPNPLPAPRNLRRLMARRRVLELPTVVQFPVNDICDAHCQMCNIWQQKLAQQILPDEVRTLFSNPLYRKVVAVGMNGGEPTLRRDLDQVAEALFAALPKLKAVSIITNGTHSDRVIERIESLARVVHAHGASLDVMVSLDGVGGVHDRVRGREGNFASAVEVIDHVRRTRCADSLRIGCTVIRENVFHLHALLDFCRERGVYVKFRLGVPHRRLYNLTAPVPKQIGKRSWLFTHPFDLDANERAHFAEFLHGLIDHYEPSYLQQEFYRSLIGQLVQGQPRTAGCDWQRRGVTVSSRGEVMYCAVQSRTLGNGITGDSEALYFGNEPYLKEILATKCASCAHDYTGATSRMQRWQAVGHNLARRFGVDLRALARHPLIGALVRIVHRMRKPRRFHRLSQQIECLALGPQRDGAPPGVLICGWYGTETLGDKAILGGLLLSLRGAGYTGPVAIASLHPYVTAATCLQMPELGAVDVLSIEQAAKRLPEASLLVFGGGPLMALTDLAPIEGLFRAAKASGVPTLIAGCGVGPLGAEYLNRSLANVLRLANQRIYRDRKSLQLAESLAGPQATGGIAEDPSFVWLRHTQQSQRPMARSPRPTLALAMREWPIEQYAAHLKRSEARRIRTRFEEACVSGLLALAQRMPTLRILPVPFCTNHFGGDDRFYFYELMRRHPALRPWVDKSLLETEHSPAALVERLSEVDGLLAMRFHSAVFGLALGLPTLMVDYTLGAGKSAALARETGLTSVSLDAVDAASLVQHLEQLLAGRQRAPQSPHAGFEGLFAEYVRAAAPNLPLELAPAARRSISAPAGKSA